MRECGSLRTLRTTYTLKIKLTFEKKMAPLKSVTGKEEEDDHW